MATGLSAKAPLFSHFRDIIDLPPCDGSSPIHELVMGTVEDLHNLYPNVVPCNLNSEIKGSSINQGLEHLYTALKSIGDSWAKNHKWITNCGDETEDSLVDNISLEQLGELVQAKLKYMTNIAKKMFDVMEEDEKGSTIGDVLYRSYSDNKTYCPSPDTPTSFPPELTFATRLGELAAVSCSRPLLLPLRLQAMGNLMPTDMKCLSSNMYLNVSAEGSSPTRGKNKAAVDQNPEILQEIAKESQDKVSHERLNDSKATNTSPKFPNFSSDNMMPKARELIAVPLPPPKPLFNTPPTIPTTVPSPPSIPPSNLAAAPPLLPPKGSAPAVSPPMPLKKGAAPPPPPPLGVAKALRPKKATTKLKRSTHMGNMYRILLLFPFFVSLDQHISSKLKKTFRSMKNQS